MTQVCTERPFAAIGLLFLLLFSPSVACASETPVAASPPWSAHGSLQVSDNGRYFVFEDGTPFVWIGDTVWGMTEWLPREDVDLYLDDRMQKGVNVIQLCVLWGKRHEDPVRFCANAPNGYGHRALRTTGGIPDPAKPAIVPGGSPHSPNDYWDHVEYVLRAAESRGMYVALLPVWGRRYVNATHSGASVALFDDENARAYGEFLGERFRSHPNIIWVLGGDVKAVQPDLEVDRRSTYRAMAEGIALGVTTKRVAWDEPDAAWDDVFMTYHPDGDPQRNSSDWFHQDPWLDFNMIETHVHRDKVYDAVARDYELSDPVKPTVMAEPHYEGYTRDKLAEAIHMRRQAYQTFFAGGAGFTYGAHHLRPGNRGPLFSPYGDWKPMLQLEGARRKEPCHDILRLANECPPQLVHSGITSR